MEEDIKNLTRLVFECAACHKIFDEPGICMNCDIVLKAKAA